MATESLRERKKVAWREQFLANVENKDNCRLVKRILKKDPSDRSDKDRSILKELEGLVAEVEDRARKQANAKRKAEEILDPEELLEEKISCLVEAIRQAKALVVYTGAGISTAARIPDYRGPNGIWTRLSKGEKLGSYNLCDAEPTVAHMSLTKLHNEGFVKHIVSQNCDGLHIRSGLPKDALSEVHGNMFSEVCTECEDERLYYRLFDVTERTSLRRHQTGRNCYECDSPLRDTIVHFGEKGSLEHPLNWQEALDAAKKSDCILCLGSSLKVLKRYHALWGMNRVKHKRPKLFIVNLQWTPKDECATLKINARCDDVMRMVMNKLGLEIPEYKRSCDPLFTLATPLQPQELNTHSTKSLTPLMDPLNMDPLHTPLSKESQNANEEGNLKIESNNSNDHEGDAKTSCPGWYGKGFGKVKKSAKRRKTR
ncbi:NAD-dependent protein deacetylase sirtuin-7-like [Actinia tenebrosa]|uniref:protein acetyllysine N-acetyltransferase n=1 Tax=Actinia tenebrosa TaxID=6105 RepID=A0A6P8HLR2_ACTTE|nr:NAD-dependent protein deacetylase sirtuin-7-like [Actinia tenebrosa]